LVDLHAATDKAGAVLRPVPRAKRVLCSDRCLPHVVQSMLCGDPAIIDGAAALLTRLVAHNQVTLGRLYHTGAFFFALAYSGSNWGELSKLFAAAHLKQDCMTDAATVGLEGTVGKRSILGALLPESLLCVLENYGPARFAEAFLSNSDTPEVIWKYAMRGYVVDMVNQHLGDLRQRLAANARSVYDYCPIPRVIYEDLQEELWCHNFYLANLCDETRFPDWPIPEPVELLRAVLDSWRKEVEKEAPDVTFDEAREVLGLPRGEEPTEEQVRKAYRKQAMLYHPDKNPQGRDMFEKIQKAYELLSTARPAAVTGPDPVNVYLIVRTQNILFRRFAKDLEPYKYAGYGMLLTAVREATQGVFSEEAARFLVAASELVYLTCLASPLNAEELAAVGGTQTLAALLARCLGIVSPSTAADEPALVIVQHVTHTLSGLAAFESGRAAIAALPALIADIARCLTLEQKPQVMQYTLQTIARLGASDELQRSLVGAGVAWRLLPLLFKYDATMDEHAVDTTENTQAAANANAKLAVRALGRLGGYLVGPLASPLYVELQAAL
jgi:DnaJ family protein C protein 13